MKEGKRKMIKKSIEDDIEQYMAIARKNKNSYEKKLFDYRMSLLDALYPSELVTREAVLFSLFLSDPAKDIEIEDYIIPYMRMVNEGRKAEDLPYITDKQIENIGEYYKNPEAFKEVKGIEGYELIKLINSYDNLSDEDEYQIYGNHYYWIWSISLEETKAFKKNLEKVIDKEYKKRKMPRYAIGERIHRGFKSIKEMIINF